MAKLLALALDGLARLAPFTWASNATLAGMLGLSPRRVQQLLAELEAAGWIVGVFLDSRKRTRLGVALRRRVGPGTPAADTPERLAIVEEAIHAGWRPARPNPDPRHWIRVLGLDGTDAPAKDLAHPGRDGIRTPGREKVRQKNAPSSREETNQKPIEAGPAQRDDQSSNHFADGRSFVTKAPPATPEPPPSAADERLLARRTPAERERFRQLAPDVQARVLALLGRGDRPARESLRRLLEPAPSARPAPSSPATPAMSFADRCREMGASGDRRLVSGFASALALNLGSRTDQRLFGEFAKVGERICAGQLSPDTVVAAAEAAFRPGVRNAGAYWWTTLQRNSACATGAGG